MSMPRSYRKEMYQRVKRILWGPTEVIAAVLGLLVILSRPVMDYLLELWEGLPWWVGALLLGALLLYALLRAGYELWKEEGQARQKADAQLKNTEAQLNQLQDEALDRYIADMRQWIDDPKAPLDQLPPEHPHRKSAQEDTTRILSRLSPGGKREVVSFLHGRGLIKVGSPIISLVRADLSSANLSGLGLADASLSYAYLSGADLSDAQLSWLTATGADNARALIRRDASVRDLVLSEVEPSLPINVSHLIHCDLSGAILRRGRLAGCILRYANFADAELEEADIRAADLRNALNLTQEQVESAYGSKGQEGIVDDTLLPDHLEAPLKWKLPLKQQQEVRRLKS
jgi:uncharacterized protein YjbI with pentapeptide repeats